MAEQLAPPHTTVITGASGWLGRALVHRFLCESGPRRLKLLAHTTAEAHMLEALGEVDVVIGDIARPDTARRLLHQVSADCDVIHTAGIIHPRSTREFFEINANGTRHLAETAAEFGVRRLVHVSSNSPFGTNPHSNDTFRANEPYHPYLGYGRSKMQAELAVFDAIAGGLDATIVRPPWFYGPFQPPRQTTFFRLIRAGRFPVVGDGEQRRSMVYVDNLVDGVIAAELTPGAKGKAYWIADRRAYTVNEIVETVSRALVAEGLDVKAPSAHLPAIVGRTAELGDRIVQRLGRYQQQLHVLGEMNHTIACDISAACAQLGYDPRIELYEGMRASIRWCLAEGIEL
ncbi:MAG TPA: NAD(P)-dependent oxidoreductase [Ilumatobacteraceae bacterium]|nr:NAD(P)-dependent oxidoreductase [Ilumatobacteraceae bacterium]